jgi:two-component system, cell cycle response regulator DivK
VATQQRSAARILVVDDYQDAREMYAELLQHSGYDVITAKDGMEAVDLASRAPFDLVILDLAMPRMDGIAVIRTLRSRKATEDIPIITVSALVGSGMHSSVLEAGADAALDKPCLPLEMERSVRRWLAQGRRRSREKRS